MTKRRAGIVTHQDQAEDKKAPNGARATFRAIRSFWLSNKNTQMTVNAFKPHIRKFLEEFYTKFGGSIPGDIKQHIERLERGESAMQVYDIRAYAKLIGIPPSLLGFFAQMVSDEHVNEIGYKNTMLSNIRGFRKSLDVMEATILEVQNDVFSETRRNCKGTEIEIELYANIDMLRTIADAYKLEFAKNDSIMQNGNGE